MTLVAVRNAPWATLVRITGALDISAEPRLAELLAAIDGPIVLDCSEVGFVGVGPLRLLAERGVILRYPSSSLVRLTRVCGWGRQLGVD